jgi:two-component system, OmpR family, response regulator
MSKHILAIDDEQEIRDIVRVALSRQGYRVTSVADGSAARQCVRLDPPDLIICDLQLHNDDGLTLLEELKGILPDVPTILLTGILFEPKVVEATLSRLVSVYLPKPTTLHKVTMEARRLLGD